MSSLFRRFENHVYRPLVRPPADLFVGVVLTFTSVAAILVAGGPLRAAGGLVLVLFLPGYALVSALFPTAEGIPGPVSAVQVTRLRRLVGSADGGRDRAVDIFERMALSFGTSVALVPPVALVVSALGVGFDDVTVVTSLGSVTLVGLLFASHRRWQFPEGDRFQVPYQQWIAELRGALFGKGSRVDGALNLGVVLAVVVALSALAYPVLVPQTGESYTEFAVLTESESGDLVASGYPTEFVRGEIQEVVLSVENHEGTQTSYTVVVELQRVDRSSGTVSDRTRLDRFSTTLEDGGQWRQRVTITPRTTGENLRLTFYLYEGDPPAEPGPDAASERLFIWIDVTQASVEPDDGDRTPDGTVWTAGTVEPPENAVPR